MSFVSCVCSWSGWCSWSSSFSCDAGKQRTDLRGRGGGCSRHPVGLVVGVVVLVFVVTVVLVNVIVRALVVLRVVVVVHVLVVNTPVHMQLPIRIGPTCPKRVGAASSLAPAVAS